MSSDYESYDQNPVIRAGQLRMVPDGKGETYAGTIYMVLDDENRHGHECKVLWRSKIEIFPVTLVQRDPLVAELGGSR